MLHIGVILKMEQLIKIFSGIKRELSWLAVFACLLCLGQCAISNKLNQINANIVEAAEQARAVKEILQKAEREKNKPVF